MLFLEKSACGQYPEKRVRNFNLGMTKLCIFVPHLSIFRAVTTQLLSKCHAVSVKYNQGLF